MRVLHLDGGREMRGGQWQVLRLIEGLQAAGVECTILARADTPLMDKAQASGCKTGVLGWWRAAAEMRRHDIVHVHDSRSHTMAAVLGGAKLVVSRRVAFPISSRWKYRRAAHCIAVSEFVAQVVEDAGVTRTRISVVYDCVPLLDAAGPRKGVVAMDNAADPMKGAAIIAGAAELADVEVKFSRDLEHDLPRASVFLYVTHSEGLGSAALLAMSAGAAVVASEVGGLPEIVRHEETGLLVENTPQSVASAMRRLLEEPAWRDRLAAAARRRVEQEFTPEVMVHKTMAIYKQVLA